MTRFIAALAAALLAFAPAADAQSFTALARLDPDRSSVTDTASGADVTLTLSQPVPYRLRLLAEPPRLVVDFRTAAFDRLTEDGLGGSQRILGLRHGATDGGWSRLILDLARPMLVDRAGMVTGASDGSARIEMTLVDTDAATFLSAAATLEDTFTAPTPPAPSGRFVVALDPGHGGVDPGAVRDGVHEADLMLTFARELRDMLRRTGEVDVVLTRDDDIFVSLEARIATAKRAGADVFVSLHADAIAEGIAKGAQIYTLSAKASDTATAQLAERHDRSDLLEGVDLSAQDDPVARVLMSMARTKTTPRTDSLAQSLIGGLREAGVRLHRRAHEKARFSVLKSADMPSVLLEVGFMSSPSELKRLQTPEWRQQAAIGLVAGLLAWRDQDAERDQLRQN